MITAEILNQAKLNLDARSANLRTMKFANPVERTFSLRELHRGLENNDVKSWLEKELSETIKLPAIYVLTADSAKTAKILREAFVSIRENPETDHKLPKGNTDVADDAKVLYVGSSRKIRQRMKQHLLKAAVKTYAMKLHLWAPDVDGSVMVQVQSITEKPDHRCVQDIEDALWSSMTPIFGKYGGK